jgi:hypothetical protein
MEDAKQMDQEKMYKLKNVRSHLSISLYSTDTLPI